jgi:hypothetical protein
MTWIDDLDADLDAWAQMDEIRNDVNMLMRTLGMKIHATPLLKFRESIKQMKKDGVISIADKGKVTTSVLL